MLIFKRLYKTSYIAFLSKLNTFSKIEKQIKACLKTKVKENKIIISTDQSIAKNVLISSLLINITFHLIKFAVKKYVMFLKLKKSDSNSIIGRKKLFSIHSFKYADDFWFYSPTNR